MTPQIHTTARPGSVPGMQKVAVTGGSGTIASSLRPRLFKEGRSLILLDIQQPSIPVGENETFVLAGLDEVNRMTEAFTGCGLVVHLGGIPTEASWEEILTVNIDGTRNVLEAARLAGVQRVLLASSIHVVGMYPTDAIRTDPVPAARPDGFYGVGKAAAEALGSMYADRHGMSIVSLRIANFAERPSNARGLALWLSPDDCARAVESAFQLGTPGHHTIWGVSANTRSPVNTSAGALIGFTPMDDAERFADLIDSAPGAYDGHLGGAFLAPERPPGRRFA